MGLEQSIDITATQRNTVLTLLQRHLPRTEAWVYGSRAKWTARPQSDLDLVVFATPKQRSRIGALREAFEECDLPFRVDLFVWEDVPEEFREEIESEHIVLVVRSELGRSREEDEWIKSTLGDVSDFVSGGTPAKSNAEYWDGLIPWVSAKDMKHFRIYDTKDHVTDAGVDNGTKLVPKGTVLLLVRGMRLVNEVPVCVAQRPMTFNQDVKALRAKSNVTSQYLPYLLLGNKQRLLSLVDLAGHGTGRLNSDELKALDVVFPAPTKQCDIAQVLGTLDDKIDLNRRMNETLEAMASNLFKSWFVDFDPARAKMEGRDIGLSQDIADLFPDAMMDSAVGSIPKGWSVFRLDQLADHHTRSVAPNGFPELEFEHFSIPAHDTGRIPAIETGGAIKSNKTVVPSDSVLLSKLNPEIQRVWVPDLSSGRHQVSSTEFLVFTPRHPATRSLLFSLFTNTNFQAMLRCMVTGTSKSHQRVPPRALKQQEVLCGTTELFSRFDEQTAPLLAQTIRNRAESHTLATLRDELLPKLISGEIRLRMVENLEDEACTG